MVNYLEGVLFRFLLIIVLSGLGAYLLSKLLPKTTPYKRLILGTELSKESGYTSGDSAYREFIGREGVTQTPLRPSGIAMFGDERLDVITRGDMVQTGQKVRVAEVHGSRIIVDPVE